MIEMNEKTFIEIPIACVIRKLHVRSLSKRGVARIQESIQRLGFLDNYPLIVSPIEDGYYKLVDGNHRYEAAKKLGLTSVPCMIKDELTEQDQYKLALESNNAAETVVPSTLVTHAEFVRARINENYTLPAIAEIMGWSRDKVKNYSMLRNIRKKAWQVIGTTFENSVPDDGEGFVLITGTTVPTFTEGLLRDILQLRAPQQYELVYAFAHPNEKERISKGKFKTLAEAYKIRNNAKKYAIKQLGVTGYSFLKRACREIDRGSYDRDWSETTNHPKLAKLIEALQDEWEEKNNIHLVHGDFYEAVKKVGDGSVDLILTDPPYNIARDNEFELEGRSNISQNFGEWDKFTNQQFIDLFSTWASEWARVLREQGSGYVFTSDSYISHLRSALEHAGLHVKATIIWHKSNPGTQIVKTNFKSSVEYILFFTKGEGGHTFNWQGENEMHNFIDSPVCSGNERLTDAKGNTLHPTQKPERVLRHFMEISSNRGDMVLDGFMGAGSTGSAARKMGRKFIGIEQDKTFFEAAQRRLAE